MRNNDIVLTERITDLISSLPYFELADLSFVGKNKTYLKIILSRYEGKGEILRLKKGLYVSNKYLEEIKRKNIFSDYLELAANQLYEPSYLSLDYVLFEHGVLTEIPRNFISVSLNKTATLSNELGNFYYHNIKKELFTGFIITKKGDFLILKASRAKALFDFLYFRKNNLIDNRAIKELRLNLDNMKSADWWEFKRYLKIDDSKKMREIFNQISKIL